MVKLNLKSGGIVSVLYVSVILNGIIKTYTEGVGARDFKCEEVIAN